MHSSGCSHGIICRLTSMFVMGHSPCSGVLGIKLESSCNCTLGIYNRLASTLI